MKKSKTNAKKYYSSKQIALRLPEDLNGWLKKQAEFRMVSKSALVRMALADYAKLQGKTV